MDQPEHQKSKYVKWLITHWVKKVKSGVHSDNKYFLKINWVKRTAFLEEYYLINVEEMIE